MACVTAPRKRVHSRPPAFTHARIHFCGSAGHFCKNRSHTRTAQTPAGLGCVNGVPYNQTTQAPCGNYILNLTAGQKCCPNGLLWHSFNESCCFEPNHPVTTYVVVPRPNACVAQ